MLPLVPLLVLTGSGEDISLISEIDIRGDLNMSRLIQIKNILIQIKNISIPYLGIRQAPFLACWKDIGGGEREGGGVGRDGGGIEVSTLAGNGTTPDIE